VFSYILETTRTPLFEVPQHETGLRTSPYTDSVRFALNSSLFVLIALAGCARDVDNFNPQIVITQPLAGAILSNTKTIVKGYAYDDRGINKLVVADTDLLSDPAFRNQRGKKLVRFAFTASSIAPGRTSYKLRAVDVSGRSTERELELLSDTTKPSLEKVSLEGQINTVSITGTAKDNVKVAQITVDGIQLNIAPAPNVPFYRVVPRTRNVTVVVKDSVGNTFTQDFRSPPAPPPPPPAVTETTNPDGTTTTPTPRRRRRARSTTQLEQPRPTPPPSTTNTP
jgi:hypothetical protein